MKTKQTTPPAIDDTRRAIAADITRDAIANYHAALTRYDDIRRRIAGDGGMDRFLPAVWTEVSASETALVRAILSWCDGYKGYSTEIEKHLFPNRGVSFGGKIYLAIQDEDQATDELFKKGDGDDVMHLRVVDAVAIVSLDPAE